MTTERPRRRLTARPDTWIAGWLLTLAIALTLVLAVTSCLATAGLGGSMAGVVADLAWPTLLPPLAIAAAVTFWSAGRRRGALVCLLALPAAVGAVRLLAEQRPRQVAAHLIAKSRELDPLIAALGTYTAEHGKAPKALDALVPRYLPMLPSSGESGTSLSYDATGSRRLRFRLAGGGELQVGLAGYRVASAVVTGTQGRAANEFDPFAWRAGRGVDQALAAQALVGRGLSPMAVVSLLGEPDQKDDPPEGAWMLTLRRLSPGRGVRLMFLPTGRYPLASPGETVRRVGRWWLSME